MKLWMYALGMCQSMFCALPFPWHGWEEKARDKMLLCLPVIGLEIGLLWWGTACLCDRWGLTATLRAFVLAAVPFLLTGFMHLDGFMDVTDAVRSYRSLEQRREILKDSHVGSFAVIGVVLVILAQFSAAVCLYPGIDLRAMILIPVVSRACSVLAVFALPPMTTSQYAGRDRKNVWAALVLLAVSVAAGFCIRTKAGLTLLAVLAGYAVALLRAYKSLKGMNGDISGYCITLAELSGLVMITFLM